MQLEILSHSALKKGILVNEYAETTAPSYCAGFGDICENAVSTDFPIVDVMHYLMYVEIYGDQDRAVTKVSATVLKKPAER